MAKWHFPLVVGALLAQLALVGCQQNSPAVSTLPPPSFDAPRLAAARPAPAPVAVQPRPTPPLPAPSKTVIPPKVAANTGVPRDWVPPVAPRPWRWIVIHHSATTTGGAAAFDTMHRAKGWDELGYDFVIGNGTDTADGQIEVGPRWTKQKYGAHAKTPDNRFNEYGIGICLVGNFDVERPTPKQMQSLTRLVSYLMRTYHITPDRVMGHSDTKPTECPGKYMNVALIRRQAGQLAGTAAAKDTAQATTAHELLTDTAR
jgi:N-acetylmuramoyl-L-alanine amidase